MEQSISSFIWIGLYQLFRHHSVSFRLMADWLWQTVEVCAATSIQSSGLLHSRSSIKVKLLNSH